jgi:hypothetical protein
MRFALFAALLLAACSPKEYHCMGDHQCVATDTTFGVCIDSHCAFEDKGCTGRLRFDDSAGDQAKMCVSLEQVGAHDDAGVAGHPDGPGPDAPLTAADAPAGG